MKQPDLVYAIALRADAFTRGVATAASREVAAAQARELLQAHYLVHSLRLAGVDPRRIVIQGSVGLNADVRTHFRKLRCLVQTDIARETSAPGDIVARLRRLLDVEADGYVVLPSNTLALGPLAGFFEPDVLRLAGVGGRRCEWWNGAFLIPRTLAARVKRRGVGALTAQKIRRVPGDRFHSTDRNLERVTTSPIPISLLIYRPSKDLDAHAKFKFKTRDHPRLTDALCAANRVVQAAFDNSVFWRWRYAVHPGIGPGRGSQGRPLAIKRGILRKLGIERARSVLDVGCGDLKLLHRFKLKKYVGADSCPEAIAVAKSKRRKWDFVLIDGKTPLQSADTVLCFEVLIHQRTREDYDRLIALLCEKTERRLVVSGHGKEAANWVHNHTISYHEPLDISLKNTGMFKSVKRLGAHTSVEIYRALKKTEKRKTRVSSE